MVYQRKPADEKIEQYLNSIDDSARPAEIASETGLSKSYVTGRCKEIAEADRIARIEGGYVIGHNIPGLESPVILPDSKEALLSIVRELDSDRLPEMQGRSIDDVRKFIKNEFVTATYSLPNRKVRYASG